MFKPFKVTVSDGKIVNLNLQYIRTKREHFVAYNRQLSCLNPGQNGYQNHFVYKRLSGATTTSFVQRNQITPTIPTPFKEKWQPALATPEPRRRR